MKRVVLYGDSNTWGYNEPMGGIRFENRWPKLLKGYEIVEEGLNGRTTVFDNNYPYRNGIKGFGYVLLAQKPVDLLVIALGINDLGFTDAQGSAEGLRQLLELLEDTVKNFPSSSTDIFTDEKRVLVIPAVAVEGSEESYKLAEAYKKVAEEYGCYYLDPNQDPSITLCPNGVHLDENGHKNMAKIVQAKLDEIFSE